MAHLAYTLGLVGSLLFAAGSEGQRPGGTLLIVGTFALASLIAIFLPKISILCSYILSGCSGVVLSLAFTQPNLNQRIFYFLVPCLLLVFAIGTLKAMSFSMAKKEFNFKSAETEKTFNSFKILSMTLGQLIATLLGPLLAEPTLFWKLWLIVAVLLKVAIFFEVKSKDPVSFRKTVMLPKVSILLGDLGILWPLVLSLAFASIIAGFFQLAEPIYLLRSLKLAPGQISFLFGATLIANVAVQVVWPNLRLKKIFSISWTLILSSGLISACTLFLFTSSFAGLIGIALLIGILNGLFTLTVLQCLMSEGQGLLAPVEFRIQMYRFVANFSVFLSIALSVSLMRNLQELGLILGLTLISMILVSFIVFILKNRFIHNPNFVFIAIALLFVIPFSEKAQATIPKNFSLAIGINGIPNSQDPADILDISSAFVSRQVFENLYVYDEKNHLQPFIVSAQYWSKDHKSLELQIDLDHRFSDGEPLTAHSVVTSLTDAALKMGKSASWALGKIRGFNSFIAGKSSTLSGLTALSDSNLKVEFSEPFPFFPHALTSPYFAIAKRNPSTKRPDGDKLPITLGSGKYKWSGRTDRQLTLTKVNAALDGATTLQFRILGDAVEKLKAEDLEKLDLFSTSDEVNLKMKSHLFQDYPLLQTIVLILNTKNRKFDSAKKRCQFVEIFGGLVKTSEYKWAPLSHGMPMSWEFSKQDVFAKTALKNQSKESVEIFFADSTASFSDRINAQISENSGKYGKKTVLTRKKIRELVPLLKSSQYEATMIGFIPDVLHPDGLLSSFVVSGQQYNFSGYANPTLDRILDQARRTWKSEEQNSLYKAAFGILNKDCPVAFLGSQAGRIYKRKNLIFPAFNSLGIHQVDLSKVQLQ